MSGWHEKGTFQGTNRVIIVFGITISTAKLCTRITQYVHSPLLVYSLTTLGYKLGKTVQISEALSQRSEMVEMCVWRCSDAII